MNASVDVYRSVYSFIFRFLFIGSYYRHSIFSLPLLKPAYTLAFIALDSFLTPTDIPQNVHIIGGTFGIYAVRLTEW